MNNLKILRCYLKVFRNHHLVAIADALPWLEELDIQLFGFRSYYQRGSNSKSAKYIVTDVGIEVISCKLPRLRKIDIAGQLGCSDGSLIVLSSNCELLNEIRCCYCNVSKHCICFILRHSQNLISLEAGRYYSLPDDPFTFENYMNFAQSLRGIRIDAYEDHDRLLGSISTAGNAELKNVSRVPKMNFYVHGFSYYY
ncbi:hypothetical protein LOK49_LG14G01577 [Camellia lanceoleosa]|uniref:Uncharacterized protein n=1 Tax=Camellia lanceoleosa TaxID=1840588 RepID=A0ACC0F8H8_9ERIC|nr:hypothetical protein LOK49_LG14G01577 [Camellia lanceoleosa]